MDRRSFLTMLGLAPFAAREVVKDLSSAYDFRFGNGIYASSLPQLLRVPENERLSGKLIALEFEQYRKEIPALYRVDMDLLTYLKDYNRSYVAHAMRWTREVEKAFD